MQFHIRDSSLRVSSPSTSHTTLGVSFLHETSQVSASFIVRCSRDGGIPGRRAPIESCLFCYDLLAVSLKSHVPICGCMLAPSSAIPRPLGIVCWRGEFTGPEFALLCFTAVFYASIYPNPLRPSGRSLRQHAACSTTTIMGVRSPGGVPLYQLLFLCPSVDY